MSVRDTLLPYTQEPEQFKIKRPPPHKNGKPNPFYTVWEALLLHARASEAQKELPEAVFNDYFKFGFVRNPWDWQVSMYHFILNEPTHVRHDQVAALGSFDRYLDWVVNTPSPYPKGATKHQHQTLADREGRLLVDYVGHYETLEQDFAHVCREVGVVAHLSHLNRSYHRPYWTYYTEESRQKVADHFAQDIEMFGYSFHID